MFLFIPLYNNIDKIFDKFWSKNAKKIMKWYPTQKKDDEDIIVSASLGFIIKPVMEMLNIKTILQQTIMLKLEKFMAKIVMVKQRLKSLKECIQKQSLKRFIQTHSAIFQ